MYKNSISNYDVMYIIILEWVHRGTSIYFDYQLNKTRLKYVEI